MEDLKLQIAQLQAQVAELNRKVGFFKIDIKDIDGYIETVTSVPTGTPSNVWRQMKFYVDSLSSPSTKRLYIYSNKLNSWSYVALT